jgi:DNA ligase-1
VKRFAAALRAHEKGEAEAFVPFFRQSSMGEAVCALRLLSGEAFPFRILLKDLEALVLREAALPDWLVLRCKRELNHLPEVLARLWPRDGRGLSLTLTDIPAAAAQGLSALFDEATPNERIILIQLLTNKLHLSLSTGDLARILAKAYDADPILLETRLLEALPGTPAELEALFHPEAGTDPLSWRPYPFLKPGLWAGTHPGAWPSLEWKWDGLRCQLLRRPDKILLWSENEGLVTNRFSGIIQDAEFLPLDTVLEGIVMPWRDDKAQPAYLLDDTSIPVIFMAWDCLEVHGVDIRALPLFSRRMQLLPMFGNDAPPSFRCSEELRYRDAGQAAALHAQSHQMGARGLVLKPSDSPYADGEWQLWPAEARRLKALFLYCVKGPSTEYAFGLKHNGGTLALGRVTEKQAGPILDELEAYVREHRVSKQGPVHTVAPGLVCELAFDEQRPSTRHKAGWVLKGLRALRCLPGEEADCFPGSLQG